MTTLRVALIALGVLGMGRSITAADAGDEKRTLETTADVLQCVFSQGNQPDILHSPDALWFVRGRVIPHADAEWQYTVRQMGRDRSVEVELLWVQSGRLLGSPETIQARTCAELLSFAKVARRTVTAKQCGPLRKVVSRFERLKLPSVPDGSIRIHASQYAITAGTSAGDEFQWRVAGWPDDNGSAHPLVAWSEDLRRAVESCPP
jgi:hypothetical protein